MEYVQLKDFPPGWDSAITVWEPVLRRLGCVEGLHRRVDLDGRILRWQDPYAWGIGVQKPRHTGFFQVSMQFGSELIKRLPVVGVHMVVIEVKSWRVRGRNV